MTAFSFILNRVGNNQHFHQSQAALSLDSAERPA